MYTYMHTKQLTCNVSEVVSREVAWGSIRLRLTFEWSVWRPSHNAAELGEIRVVNDLHLDEALLRLRANTNMESFHISE